MDQSLLNWLRRSGLIRSVLAVAATLLLGALGSGLWELLLKDLFIGLGNFTLSILTTVWSGYVDILHKDIGKMDSDLLTVPVYATVITIFFGMPWFLIYVLMRMLSKYEQRFRNPDLNQAEDDLPVPELIRRVRKKIHRLLVPLATLVTVMLLIVNWQILYSREAGNWALRSIDILAPYTTAEEHVRLVSALRQVESAEQFFSLRQRLAEHANSANIRLPKFTPLGESKAAQPIIPPDAAR